MWEERSGVKGQLRTNGSDADSVSEPVVGPYLLQAFLYCPRPQVPTVESLVHIAQLWTGNNTDYIDTMYTVRLVTVAVTSS